MIKVAIKVAMIPEWEKYNKRIFKKGILYVTPGIEMDLWSDSDFKKYASFNGLGGTLKEWEVRRYMSGRTFGPGNEGDPNGVLRALAWHENFRSSEEWEFTNDESTKKERHLFFNKVLPVTTTTTDDLIHHAVLSAEVNISTLLDADPSFLLEWTKYVPEIR